MLQPPRATVDEARRLFLSAEQEHRDRPLQRDLYLQAAKAFLAAASSEHANDRAAIDALVFLSNTSLRRSEHVNAIIDSSRTDKGNHETIQTKGTNPVTTISSMDQSDRSNYSFRATISGRVSGSLLASHSSNMMMNDMEKSTSSSTLRVSGLRNIPKALPGARVDAVNDLFFLEKKLYEMGMLSTTTSSFKVDNVGISTSHENQNIPHGGTAYLASALGESFMLLSAGGKPPTRKKGNHIVPKNEEEIHSSTHSHPAVITPSPGASGNGGNVTAAYGGVKASKPSSSSVTTAATSTHRNNNNNNSNNNNNNNPQHDNAGTLNVATTAGSGKAGYTQWVVSAAKDLAVTYSTTNLPWAAPWTTMSKSRPAGNDDPLVVDKGQGLAPHYPTSHGGSLPSTEDFGVHWNDDQSTYPLQVNKSSGPPSQATAIRSFFSDKNHHRSQGKVSDTPDNTIITRDANGLSNNLISGGSAKSRVGSDSEGGRYHGMGQGTDESITSFIHHDYNNEGVLRLLKSVKRLGDENASLLHRLEHLHNVESQNASLVREMATFRSEYQKRFVKLKEALKAFQTKYPGLDNPANTIGTFVPGMNAANVDNNSSSEENSNSESLVSTSSQGLALSNQRQHQLERTIKALVGRLEAAKEEMTKKDKLIGKYEKYYAQLKKEAERREGMLISERTGATTGETNVRPASSPSSSSGLKTGQVPLKPQNTTISQQQHPLQHAHYLPHQQSQQHPQQYPLPHRVSHSHIHAHHSNPATATMELQLQRERERAGQFGGGL